MRLADDDDAGDRGDGRRRARRSRPSSCGRRTRAYYGYGRRVETLPDACVAARHRHHPLARPDQRRLLRFLAVDRDGLSPMRRDLLAPLGRARRRGAHRWPAGSAGAPPRRRSCAASPRARHDRPDPRREARVPALLRRPPRQRSAASTGVEREVFGFGAPELGARLAELWRFPPPICEAIAQPGRPRRGPPRALARRARCTAADWLAAEMGQRPASRSTRRVAQKRAADVFGMSPSSIAELVARSATARRVGDRRLGVAPARGYSVP